MKYLLLLISVVAEGVLSAAKDFYCSDTSSEVNISGESMGRIFTRFDGKNYYLNNQKCIWQINAGAGNRVHFVIESSHLQYAPPEALCPHYDHVRIIEDEILSVSWCGEYYPESAVSKTNKVTVIFESDESNPHNYGVEDRFKGAVIHFEVFPSTDCPPNWVAHDQSCFKVTKNDFNWVEAQKVCNLEYANLASIINQAENDFVIRNFKYGKIWIGLNDIGKYGSFSWIDQASVTETYSSRKTLSPRRFRHCVSLDTLNDQMTAEDCERYEFKALCRTGKGRPSDSFPIPLEKTDKGSGDSSNARIILLAALVPAVVILVLVLVGLYICHKKRDRARDVSEPERRENTENFRPLSPTAPSPPPDEASIVRPPDYQRTNQGVAPPSYEESWNDPKVNVRL